MAKLGFGKPRLGSVKPRLGNPPKVAAPIYGSQEHAAWARLVKERAGFRCQRCGTDRGRMHADHIHELQDGGAPFDPDNGECLCTSCHGRKTAEQRARRNRAR